MDGNLVDTIVNQVIGAIIGTIVSFVISWYFYVKSDGPGRIVRSMIEQLTLATIQERLGGEYTMYSVPDAEQPKDKDVPHIVRYWLPNREPKSEAGGSMIFRTVDKGLNFMGQIEVREDTSNQTLRVKSRGYGYYSVVLPYLQQPVNENGNLFFNLTDSIGKTHAQRIMIH